MEMGEEESVTVGVRIPVSHSSCSDLTTTTTTGAVCWDLALPIRVQTMANWHKERLQDIAGKVIARAAEED